MRIIFSILLITCTVFSQNLIIHKSSGSIEKISISAIQKITFDLSAVSIENMINLPKISKILSRIYPNPFNPTANIEYSISQKSLVGIAVFDLNGRMIKQLNNNEKAPGTYHAVWDGTDTDNRKVSSGIYVCHIVSNGSIIQNKMFLIK